jgi:hypothetical protein
MHSCVGFENGEAIADLDQPKAQRLRDRRRRELAVNQSPKDLQAGHPGNLFRRGDAVA